MEHQRGAQNNHLRIKITSCGIYYYLILNLDFEFCTLIFEFSGGLRTPQVFPLFADFL